MEPIRMGRPSALKRENSRKPQVNVQFAVVEPTSPRDPPFSPDREQFAVRNDYRPSLRRNGSNGYEASLPQAKLAAHSEETNLIVQNDPPSKPSDVAFPDHDQPSVKVDTIRANELQPAFLDNRATGERSSARPCAKIEDVEVIQRIVDTLKTRKIPGPQLLRTDKEFRKCLGAGGEGNVRGTDDQTNDRISRLAKDCGTKWLASKLAVKRYGPCRGVPKYKLKNYLAAAEAEVNALTNLFRGHPNIVQLRGWGICLDMLEGAQSLSSPAKDSLASNIHLPLLVLERADGDLKQFLNHIFASDDGPGIAGSSPESRAEAGISMSRERSVARQLGSGDRESSRSSSLSTTVPDEHDDTSASASAYHTPAMVVPGSVQPELGSLSGSTVHGEESSGRTDSPLDFYHDSTDPGLQSDESSNRAPTFWIVNGMDRHEILRNLCIDIGHGLQSLHSMNMTHGDLKPQNILVFRQGPRWTAKICDFGHSNSFNLEEGNFLRANYNGTPDWRPWWFGAKAQEHSVEALKRFDLTVYGALVWSAFYLKGKAPVISDCTVNPCTQFDKDFNEAGSAGCSSYLLGRRAALARRLHRLVKGTVFQSHEECTRRSRTEAPKYHPDEYPWEHMYSKTERATRFLWSHVSGLKDQTMDKVRSIFNAEDCVEPPASPNPQQPSKYPAGDLKTHRYLKPTIKAQYNEWMTTKHPPNRLGSPSTRLTDGNGDTIKTPLSPIHDHNSLARELEEVLVFLKQLENGDSLDTAGRYGMMYNLARCRANEVNLASWKKIRERKNIVEMALSTTPHLDICTLAWLCRGEVGTYEVRRLPATHCVWGAIVYPGILNESERLERFLLLMQSGACIEKMLLEPPPGHEPRPILITYLLNCRLATISVVAKEICQRYEQLLDKGKPGRNTRYFMTAASFYRLMDGDSVHNDIPAMAWSTVLGRLSVYRERLGAAYAILKLNFEQLLDETNDIALLRATEQHPTETTPLLSGCQNLASGPTARRGSKDMVPAEAQSPERSDSEVESFASETHGLPIPKLKGWSAGWVQRGNAFVNELTGSITLQQPQVQLEQLRSIPIGQIGTRSAWDIDIADFALHHDGMGEGKWDDIKRSARERFPMFDDKWFANECHRDIRTDDVLGEIKDGWEVASFEIKLPEFRADEFMAKNLGTLVFFIQYPLAALGLLWELMLKVHNYIGAPLEVSYKALREELVSLDMSSSPLPSLLSWTARVMWRIVMLMMSAVVCLLGAILIVAIVLAITGL
ncbi:hypothetical protein S40288_11478 [Stachybotrys chartarum IBT 40288]|nr:hypothetical protein S40288_11478 [Stachybotrys chartarum IBT 40288]